MVFTVIKSLWNTFSEKIKLSNNYFLCLFYEIFSIFRWVFLFFGLILFLFLLLLFFDNSPYSGYELLIIFQILFWGHQIIVIVLLIKTIVFTIKRHDDFIKKTVFSIITSVLLIFTLLVWQTNLIIFSNSIAKVTGNNSFCKLPFIKMSESEKERMLSTWSNWYSKCLQDTNYESFTEQECSIYTPNTHMYASCKLREIASKTIYSNESISCENMYVYGDKCKRLQIVQEAIQKDDSKKCTKLYTKRNGAEFALCISQFMNSNEWIDGCKKLNRNTSNNSYYLVSSKCLTSSNVNITLPGSIKGPSNFDYYNYKSPHYSPAWFDQLRVLAKSDFDYLKNINANPNLTDDYGRTALIIEIQERLYLNDSLIHDFDSLSKKEQPRAAEKATETMKLLIEFGVDPNKKDQIDKSAIDYAQDIKNDIFREKALNILQK